MSQVLAAILSTLAGYKGLHRNMIQAKLPSVLALADFFGKPLANKSVVGREKGYVTVMVPSSYAVDVATFVETVERACAVMGVEFELIQGTVKPPSAPHFTSPSNKAGCLALAFTNEMLDSQCDFGARGMSKLARDFADIALDASHKVGQLAEEATSEADETALQSAVAEYQAAVADLEHIVSLEASSDALTLDSDVQEAKVSSKAKRQATNKSKAKGVKARGKGL